MDRISDLWAFTLELIQSATFTNAAIGLTVALFSFAMYASGTALAGQHKKLKTWARIGSVAFVVGWLNLIGRSGRLLYEYSDTIFGWTEHGWFLLPALILAAVLYWLRGYAQIPYGIIEITVGSLAISVATQSPMMPARLFSLASGIYVIVRGLDNIEKGLSVDGRHRWQAVFPVRTRATKTPA